MTPDLLHWLAGVRRLVLVAQLVLLLVAFGTGERPVAGLGLLVLLTALEGGRTALGLRGSVAAHGVLDGLALTALVAAWGEAHQPLQIFWLVEVALFATLAEPRQSWLAVGGALLGQSVALALPVLGGWAASVEPPVHLVAHAATFGLAASALAHFLGRVAHANRNAQQDRARAARLASIGSLAAGVAHELATPLGSIELLAEEIRDDPAALPALQAQLARCRSILDRLLARGEGAPGVTDSVGEQVARWLAEWRAANPSVPLQVELGELAGAVRGGPEGWRQALWTVLDNARRAGPPIRVTLAPAPGGALLAVEDEGQGLSAEVASRVGEPFLSDWPSSATDRRGAGLGLYVARTFAREAGGDVRLEPKSPRGARASLIFASWQEGPPAITP